MNFKHLYFTVSLFLIGTFSFTISLYSQIPEIGKPIPNYTLSNVTHFKSKVVSISDFKGRWLLLDMWSTGCSGCASSFSKTSVLADEFRDQVNWVLVGDNSREFGRDPKAVETMYEKLRVKQNLNLIAAFDSVLLKRWEIPFVPLLFVIDPSGVLRYITGPESVTSEKMSNLLKGEKVIFYDYSIGRGSATMEDILSDKAIYRSIITHCSNERVVITSIDDFVKHKARKNNTLMLTRCNLSGLYNLAYLGDYNYTVAVLPGYSESYSYPILELRDTSLFTFDWGTVKGLYNYSLFIDSGPTTREIVMSQMQEDLKRAFGYSASMETRQIPVWKIVAGPTAAKKLKSKGGKPYDSSIERVIAGGFWVRNVPMQQFFHTLVTYVQRTERPPFINATGIDFNIDIDIQSDIIDIASIRESLNKYDLNLVMGTKDMKVVVIKD